MNKVEIYKMFGRYIQRLAMAGKKLVTVKELWELLKRGELTRQEIGWWLKKQGFTKADRRAKGKKRTREWLLNEQALGVVRKKNRIGVMCGYSCGWTGYYDMPPDEEFAPGSSCIIQKIGHPEQWKCMFCPKCNRKDHRAYYSKEVTKNVKKLKEKVVFDARKVDHLGNLVDSREGYHGPGMLETPDSLKGKW